MTQNKAITDNKNINIDKSLYRVFNTFKRLKNSLYKEDFEAMQNINDYIQKIEQENIKSEMLLLKLVCFNMFIFTEKYGNAKDGVKFMVKELENPFNLLILKLKQSINSNDLLNFYNSLGYDDIESIPIDKQKELFIKFENSFSEDTIQKALVRTTYNLLFNERVNEF